MTNKARTTTLDPTLARVQGYHESHARGTDYAQDGFSVRKYYTSDRAEKLTAEGLRPNGQPMMGYGLEVETVSIIENQTVLAELYEKLIFPNFPTDMWKMQNDCSLRGRETSAECITQTMTMECIRNNYPAWKAMYARYFPALDITAGDACCGMHVNISKALFGKTPKEQDENAKKLLFFVNHHYKFCCKLLMRNMSRLSYCEQSHKWSQRQYAMTHSIDDAPSGHGTACNLDHWNESPATARFELRIVGGQPTFAAFRNTMESVFWLMKRIKKLDFASLEKLDVVFSGCNGYVLDRIVSMCRFEVDSATLESIHANSTRKRDYI